MIEFLEDLIEADPTQEFPQAEYQKGTYVRKTGDAVADAWEKEIAEGRVPDFLAAFDAEDQEKIKRQLKKKEPEPPPVEEFHDVYAKDQDGGRKDHSRNGS